MGEKEGRGVSAEEHSQFEERDLVGECVCNGIGSIGLEGERKKMCFGFGHPISRSIGNTSEGWGLYVLNS